MAKTALCIGINDYPGTQNDLSGCVNDANDWSKTLKKRGFTTSVMIDAQATGSGIRAALRATIGAAKTGDVVVIQYSGHGSFVPDEDGDEPDGTDECICPHDINANGPITDDELFQIYDEKAEGVKLIVVSDSCHSGTVARFAPISTPASSKGKNPPRRLVRFLPPSTFLAKREIDKLGIRRSIRASSPPGRYAALLLAGCQDTEYSYDAYFQNRPNGAFSFVALAALETLPASATYADYHKAVRKKLPSQQYPQSPNLFGSSAMKKWKVFA